MIHAVCDFCGHDCDRTADLLTLTPFQNFARYQSDTQPFGSAGPSASFVICHDCKTKHGLPNPFHKHHVLNRQTVGYEKTLDSYSEEDRKADAGIEADRKLGRNKNAGDKQE